MTLWLADHSDVIIAFPSMVKHGHLSLFSHMDFCSVKKDFRIMESVTESLSKPRYTMTFSHGTVKIGCCFKSAGNYLLRITLYLCVVCRAFRPCLWLVWKCVAKSFNHELRTCEYLWIIEDVFLEWLNIYGISCCVF